jgi:hypothetical protein
MSNSHYSHLKKAAALKKKLDDLLMGKVLAEQRGIDHFDGLWTSQFWWF